MTAVLEDATTVEISDPERWSHMRELAECIWALQEARIALGNRVKATQRRGGGAVVDSLELSIDTMARNEKMLSGDLVQTMREVAPAGLMEWIAKSRGIGEPSVARLLGHIGHPRIAIPMSGDGKGNVVPNGEPYARTVSQLWQYCGVGDPKLRPRKGMTKEDMLKLGKSRTKVLVRLMAEGTLKSGGLDSQYRIMYQGARDHYEERVHTDDCPMCHAKAGDPWKPGHQHAAALRKVGKEILKDIWVSCG